MALLAHRTLRRGLAALLTAAGLVGLAAPVAGAATTAAVPCTARAASHKFFAVDLDPNSYFTAPSGTFENGTGDWTLSNAAVVSGNESYRVNGAGSSSLRIGPGGRASTPLFCNRIGEVGIRFFYTGSTWSRLHVHLDATNSDTSNKAGLDWEILVLSGGWHASSMIFLPVLYSGGYENAQVTFTVPSGSVQIDDVEIDPWKPN